MKKILVLLIVFTTSFCLPAQDRLSCSLELSAGAGFGRGPRTVLTPQLVAQYEVGGNFKLGAGIGFRFARPCFQYITKRGTHERTFCEEFDIPVILRAGYAAQRFYANIDAGYAIGAYSFLGSDWVPGGRIEPCYDGFFLEPHFGLKLSARSALALGLLLQQSVVSNHVRTETGTSVNDPSCSIREDVSTRKLLTPAVTFRYAFLF